MTKVLFCGGPADRQWRDVEPVRMAGARVVDVAKPPTPLEFATNRTGTLTKFRYKVWTVRLFGYVIDVAAPEKDHNESDSVLYAVLQRDVADHLRNKK